MKHFIPALLFFSTTAFAQYIGSFEAANCSAISGWAEDTRQPNVSITVDLYDGATLIETVAANLYRGDVGGYYGFSYATPPSLKNSQNHVIHAKIGGTTIEFWNSPITLNCAAGSTGYQYTYTDSLTASNSNWSQNGSGSFSSSGYTAAGGGTLVAKSNITPSTSPSYEVRMQLALTQSGGYYSALLRASNDALFASTVQGTFYAIEVINPTFSNGACSASLYAWKIVSGGPTLLAGTTISCHNGMVVRAVMLGGGLNGWFVAYVDNVEYLAAYDTTITSGAPGVAVALAPSGNAISLAQLGALDTIAPNAINPASVATSSFPTHVDFQWQGVADDPNGVGVAFYQIYRNGAGVSRGLLPSETEFSDTSVSPGTTYTYQIQAVDYHSNISTTTLTVATPPAGSIDPRQVGVRPTGSYWGGAGENIDMRSGNLNFTIPLLKAKGRGWTLPFNLSYNSQNWRWDAGGIWNLGRDGGFGYGWKLQTGAMAPVYSEPYAIDHYVFLDSTGAEYRLDQNNGGIWTSKQSIYVEYDSNTGRLYFPDGTFWSFGCTSSGTEEDSGVAYPTLIQDSNGNQITISYQAGQGMAVGNSSSRISAIQDVMGHYNFSYTDGWFPHLTTITSTYPAENYSFYYTPNASLVNPFTSAASGINAQMLQMATNTNSQMTTTFATNTSGELSQVTFPYGGHLRWAPVNINYVGNRMQREVQTRYLAMSSGASELAYPIWHDPADSGRSFHYYSVLDDAGGQGEKAWFFQTDTTQTGFGLQDYFSERQLNPLTEKKGTAYGWTLDTLHRPYISGVWNYLDSGTPNAATSSAGQILDQYGNMTSMSQYDFGASTPTRTYTNTYLSDALISNEHPANSTYNAEHIRNRLLTSTVTQNGQTATLVNNKYDFYDPGQCGSTRTPGGWTWAGYVTSIDPNNTSNIFRGNVTTSYGLDMTHTMCYGTTGAVVMRTDGGHTTTSDTSSQTNYTSPNTITTGSLTTNLNWTGFLALLNESGPNGDTASIYYDSAARPSTTTTPYGASTTYTYSTSPAQTTATVNTDDSHTNGRKTITKLDGLGRAIEVDSLDAGGTTRSIVQMQYTACGCSPLGKLLKKSQPYKLNDPVYWTVYSYDGLGRTLTVIAPDGASTTGYSYVGNTVTVTDPTGKQKTFTMDAFGNLTKVVEPDTSQTNTSNQATTTYTYDALNHLIGVSMPRQTPGGTVTQTRTFTYASGSVLGAYLLSAQNPENGTVNYTYGSDGTLATKWDAKGHQQGYFLQYLYDSYARVTTVQSVPGTPTSPSTPVTVLRTYTYDVNLSDDPNYSQNAWGRLTRVQYNVSGTWWTPYTDYVTGKQVQFTGDNVDEMYTYNPPGQVTGKRLRVTRTTDDGNVTAPDLNATWTYNNEGNPTGVSYPGDPNAAATYSYSYDGMGRLAGMSETAPSNFTMLSGVTYNAAGQMTQMGSESRTYNPMGQLTNITVSGSLNLTYNYSSTQNNGKISSQVDAVSGEAVSYAYDSLNRLICAYGGTTAAQLTNCRSAPSGTTWGQGFAYDPFGNLTDKNVLYGSVPPLHVVIDPTTNHAGGEDPNGNAWASGVYPAYTYDAENRMTVVHNYSGAYSDEYAYDAQNKRVWGNTPINNSGTLSDSECYYFYAPDGKLLAQFTPVYSPRATGSPASLAFQNGPTRTYFGSRLLGNEDRLGSRGKYFPYGEDRTSPPSPPNDQVKFATYTRDSATGLDYADQRYYASTYGRFSTPDKYQASAAPRNPQSWNRYAYALGDPANFFDPVGLCPWDEDDWDLPWEENPCRFMSDSDQRPGGHGGGGGCSASTMAAYYEGVPDPGPDPGCYAPPPPPPPAPPKLECTYAGFMAWSPISKTIAPNGNVVNGSFLPTTFSLYASGGTGDYQWSVQQTVNVNGQVLLDTGHIENLGDGPFVETIPNYSDDPSHAVFRDTPGLISPSALGNIVSAVWIFNATTTFWLTSGGETIPCGTFTWQAYELWQGGTMTAGESYLLRATGVNPL